MLPRSHTTTPNASTTNTASHADSNTYLYPAAYSATSVADAHPDTDTYSSTYSTSDSPAYTYARPDAWWGLVDYRNTCCIACGVDFGVGFAPKKEVGFSTPNTFPTLKG